MVSESLSAILSALRRLRPRVREACADAHVFKAVEGALPRVSMRTEDRRSLRSGRPCALALFNIADLVIDYYKEYERIPPLI